MPVLTASAQVAHVAPPGRSSARTLRMCIVEPAMVEEIRGIAGNQLEIMARLGISWNSWIKVEGGLPIRLSVGERLRARILERIREMPGLEAKFPSRCPVERIDRRAVERSFLRPVIVRGGMGVPPRSVRRARAMADGARQQAC